MNKPKYIYHIAVCPKEVIKGHSLYPQSKADVEAWEKFKTTQDYHIYQNGFRYRGTFNKKKDAKKILTKQQDLYAIHEGYYDYAVIEKHYLNIIDGLVNWGEEDWFIWDDTLNCYVGIDRPKELKGTCGFI